MCSDLSLKIATAYRVPVRNFEGHFSCAHFRFCLEIRRARFVFLLVNNCSTSFLQTGIIMHLWFCIRLPSSELQFLSSSPPHPFQIHNFPVQKLITERRLPTKRISKTLLRILCIVFLLFKMEEVIPDRPCYNSLCIFLICLHTYLACAYILMNVFWPPSSSRRTYSWAIIHVTEVCFAQI